MEQTGVLEDVTRFSTETKSQRNRKAVEAERFTSIELSATPFLAFALLQPERAAMYEVLSVHGYERVR